MELHGNRKKLIAQVIPKLLIVALLLRVVLMIYEYLNFNGYNLLSEFNFVTTKFFVCKGDTTTWFHPPLKISYQMYTLIEMGMLCLVICEFVIRKTKITKCLLTIWIFIFCVNIISWVLLCSQEYALSLMIYYEMFITMKFIHTPNRLIETILSLLLVVFVGVHGAYIFEVYGKKKEN